MKKSSSANKRIRKVNENLKAEFLDYYNSQFSDVPKTLYETRWQGTDVKIIQEIWSTNKELKDKMDLDSFLDEGLSLETNMLHLLMTRIGFKAFHKYFRDYLKNNQHNPKRREILFETIPDFTFNAKCVKSKSGYFVLFNKGIFDHMIQVLQELSELKYCYYFLGFYEPNIAKIYDAFKSMILNINLDDFMTKHYKGKKYKAYSDGKTIQEVAFQRKEFERTDSFLKWNWRLFTSNSKINFNLLYMRVLEFLFMHEYAHIYLNHFEKITQDGTNRNERFKMEFEADKYAYEAMIELFDDSNILPPSNYYSNAIAGVILFFELDQTINLLCNLLGYKIRNSHPNAFQRTHKFKTYLYAKFKNNEHLFDLCDLIEQYFLCLRRHLNIYHFKEIVHS